MLVSFRVVTSLAVLLVMLGLPVAPVLCDLVCPQPTVAATAAPRASRVVSTGGDAPCHEASRTAAPSTRDTVASPGPSSTPLALGTAPRHACDHPVVVASRASSEGPRVPTPAVAPIAAGALLARRQAAVARAGRLVSAAPPASRASGAFSPILRI